MKPIVKLAFFSAFFSFIYLLLEQFGIVRFGTCYMYSVNSYIEEYKNIEKMGEYKTVITLSTTYSRLPKILPVLKALLDQTVRVDTIYLTVCGKKEEIDQVLLEKIKKITTLVEMNKCKHELSSQLYTALVREGDEETRIITLSDDIIYGKDFIETLLEHSQNSDKIVYIKGINQGIENHIDLRKGALFKTKYFGSDFIQDLEYKNRNWINEYLQTSVYSKNIPLEGIEYSENLNLI
jgi:hypothetical protein